MDEFMHKDNQNIGVALTGLGGMGKTKIALEYCYRAWTCSMYQYTFWVKADSELSLQSSFEKIAKLLDISVGNTNKLDAIVAMVYRCLQEPEKRWLLVF